MNFSSQDVGQSNASWHRTFKVLIIFQIRHTYSTVQYSSPLSSNADLCAPQPLTRSISIAMRPRLIPAAISLGFSRCPPFVKQHPNPYNFQKMHASHFIALAAIFLFSGVPVLAASISCGEPSGVCRRTPAPCGEPGGVCHAQQA